MTSAPMCLCYYLCMPNERKVRQKTPWAPEVQIIITVLIILVPTPLLIYLWLLYGDFTLFGVQPTNDELFVGSILRPLILIAPFVSVLTAFILYRRIKKRNQGIMSQLSIAERASIRQRASRRYLFYAVTAGLALSILAMNQAWPSVKDYYLTAKNEAATQKAYDRGCRSTYDINKMDINDKEFKDHQTIVRQWDSDYYTEAVIPIRANVSQSFEKCKEGSIDSTEQRALVDKYRLTLEERAHELLEENPYGLSEEQIEKIRQLERENHQ